MLRQALTEIQFSEGFNNSRSPLDGSLAGTSAEGSSNNLLIGDSHSIPFGGLNSLGANTGSRLMSQVGNQYGGLKDIGASLASGSLFQDVGRSLWFIGNGQVSVNGASLTGLLASSSLRVSLAVSGVYSGTTTYDAGMPQPSAPDIGILSAPGTGHTGIINGAISCKIARLRLSTGGRSRSSTTSAVIVPSKKSIRVTFPIASAGQDNWAVFFTQQGFGGVGLHYRAAYNGALDIPESVVAATITDGVARSLEFDFADGDLIPEIAYIDDYPPPAGTHAVRLENVMHVLGCYSDSVTNPTSVSTGTCGAVSLPNFYESYKPRNLVFFPEQIVSVLARPSDSYAWIACRNSILTLQYVGLNDGSSPASTVATAFPSIGIAYPHNWVQFYGRLCLFTTKGQLVIVTEEGNLDQSFAAPVKKFIKNWLPQDTIVGFDPETNSVVIGNNNVCLAYCLDNEKWSDPCYIDDALVAGACLSCVTSNGNLLISVLNGTTATAYTYNRGSTAIPIVKVTPAQSAPTSSALKNIYEMTAALNNSIGNQLTAIAINRNLRPVSARGVSLTAGSAVITSTVPVFDGGSVGERIFIFAYNIGGVGQHYLVAKIGSVASTLSVSLVDNSGLPVTSAITVSNAFCLFGKYLKVFYPGFGQSQHVANLYPSVREARSFSIGVWMFTDAQTGSIHALTPFGTIESSSGGSAR